MGTEIKINHSTPNFKIQSDSKTKDSTTKQERENSPTPVGYTLKTIASPITIKFDLSQPYLTDKSDSELQLRDDHNQIKPFKSSKARLLQVDNDKLKYQN